MKNKYLAVLGCGALLLVSGCAGVPRLYSNGPKGAILAPKVDEIVRQVACELRYTSRTQMKGRDYVITALLNLEVSDALHLTPSLSFIKPFSTSDTNMTIVDGFDVGGERKRSFTTTLVLHSAEFQKDDKAAEATAGNGTPGDTGKPPCAGDKLYNLAGNLGLGEVVRDGLGSYLLRYGDTKPHPDDAEVKALFGSTVEFTVNTTLSALGPIWTLTRFKGPGGDGGLLNGKRVGTDTLTITFSLVANDPVVLADALRRLEHAETARLQSLEVVQTAATNNVAAQEKAVRAEQELRRLRQFGFRKNKSGQQQQLAQANQDIEDAKAAEKALEDARAARDRATRELESARTEAGQASDQKGKAVRDAAAAGQTLLNYMVLQNLNLNRR